MHNNFNFQDANCFLYGNRSLYIENYRHILQYKEDHIHIAMKKGWLEIVGAKLQILQYTGEDMQIIGMIQAIYFHN